MEEKILLQAFRRLDNDAQFHFVGCLCAMRNDGEKNLDDLIKTLTDEIFGCACIWPDKETFRQEINVACEENYFEVRSLKI